MKMAAQNRDEKRKILATAGLLLLDAMVFQEVLSKSHTKIPTLSQVRGKNDPKRELEQAWRYIVEKIDYAPVFKVSLRVLEALPGSAALSKALRRLLDAASDIVATNTFIKHDLFGRIYHTLLLGRLVKYHATYYTSIPAARILAHLALSDVDATEVPPKFAGENLRVVDFACGSGTLLAAVYKEVEEAHRFGHKGGLRLDDLHRYLIEDGLWGFDVLHHAVHLAATTVSLLNTAAVTRSRLHVLPLGTSRSGSHVSVKLGSLDFLKSDTIPRFTEIGGGSTGGALKVSVAEEESGEVRLPRFHVCIMNPPFTRSVGGNLLFGSLPKSERTILQKELSAVLRKKGWEGIGQAGLGAVFTLMADEYLEKDGVLALVLPRAVLSGVSWSKVREMLLKNYHIKYIVTSYEGNSWNFSENTDLSEVLIVAKKKKDAGYTLFVNLFEKPEKELDAGYIAQTVLRAGDPALLDIANSNSASFQVKKGGKTVAEVYSAKIDDPLIGAYNFFSKFELNRTQHQLFRHGVLRLPTAGAVGSLPLKPLGEMVEIGPDRRQVESAFAVSSNGFYDAFWGHESGKVYEITQKANAKLAPKPGKGKQAVDLWRKSGRLLIAERAWLTTYRSLAVFVDKPVLSNVWWPVTAEDEETEKALAAWFNTTFGILSLLSVAEVTRGPWVGFKKENLKRAPVPDFNPKLKTELAAAVHTTTAFESLPEEFALAAKREGARRKLDEKVLQAFGISVEEDALTKLYELLKEEPMIRGF